MDEVLCANHTTRNHWQGHQVTECYKCGQWGYYARSCPIKRRSGNTEARSHLDTSGSRATIGQLQWPSSQGLDSKKTFKWMYGTQKTHLVEGCDDPTTPNPRLGPTPTLPLKVDGISVQALVDTGCPTTVMSHELCRKILEGDEKQLS